MPLTESLHCCALNYGLGSIAELLAYDCISRASGIQPLGKLASSILFIAVPASDTVDPLDVEMLIL